MSKQKPIVKTFKIEAFIVSSIVSAASAIICMRIISRIGFTPNTSIISALTTIAIARLTINFTANSDRYRFAQARMSVLL